MPLPRTECIFTRVAANRVANTRDDSYPSRLINWEINPLVIALFANLPGTTQRSYLPFEIRILFRITWLPCNVVVRTLTDSFSYILGFFLQKERRMEVEMITREKKEIVEDLIYGGYRFSAKHPPTSWRRWVNWPSIMRIYPRTYPLSLSLSLSFYHRSKCPLTGNGRAVSVTPSHSSRRLSRFDIDTRFLLRLSAPVDR